MREQNTKAQEKKLSENTHPLSPLPHPKYKLTTPHISHPPIICNNNPMEIASLVHLRKSNECRSVRNDEMINLHLGPGTDS